MICGKAGPAPTSAVALPRKSDGAVRTEADVVAASGVWPSITTTRLSLGCLPGLGSRPRPACRSPRPGRQPTPQYGIPGPPKRQHPQPTRTRGGERRGGRGLLGTSRATLYRWLASGFITGEQQVPQRAVAHPRRR